MLPRTRRRGWRRPERHERGVPASAAEPGIELARLPSLVCREAVDDGRLRVLYGAEAALVSPVHAVYPSRQYLPAKVRLFLDALTSPSSPLAPLGRRSRRIPVG